MIQYTMKKDPYSFSLPGSMGAIIMKCGESIMIKHVINIGMKRINDKLNKEPARHRTQNTRHKLELWVRLKPNGLLRKLTKLLIQH